MSLKINLGFVETWNFTFLL